MFQHHVIASTGHLFITIIIGIIADQREGVALVHLHMTKGLE